MKTRALNAAIALSLASVTLSGCATIAGEDGRFTRADFEAAVVENRYNVYFNHGSAEIVSSGEALIDANAERAGNENFGYIITGHTDTSDEASDNLVLSRQRAEAVAGYLAAEHQVPRDRMLVSGLGETRLANPTPDGVKDPINRRVEVVIVKLGL